MVSGKYMSYSDMLHINKTSWSRAPPFVRFISISKIIDQVNKELPLNLVSVRAVYLILLSLYVVSSIEEYSVHAH